ncbi:MAG: hypothetical protein AB1608_05745 [Thermoproteota archaeon]
MESRDGRTLIALGFVSIAILFLIYARISSAEVTPAALSSIERLGIAFYGMMILALGAIAYGLYLYHRHKVQAGKDDNLSIIAQLTWNKKSKKIFAVTATGYGIFFALTSGILVYQPDVTFSYHYNVQVPSAQIAPCCGEVGYVPKFIFYITEHVGMQVIPINLVLQIAVSYLVGLNAAIAANAFAILKKGAGMGSVAAATGLFIACPTCAGTFVSLFVSASGAVAFTLAVTQLQTLFIAISIPLLIFTPVIMAKKVKSSGWSCKIES